MTAQGVSDWSLSFHAFFDDNIPGYIRIVNESARPCSALAIASAAPATNLVANLAVTQAVALDAPGTLLLLALGLGLIARALHHRYAASR